MEEKSTATLEKIQEAAMAEFLEKGFQGKGRSHIAPFHIRSAPAIEILAVADTAKGVNALPFLQIPWRDYVHMAIKEQGFSSAPVCRFRPVLPARPS